MNVYLFRHADAVDVGESGVTCDEQRMLSPKGRKQAKTMARALRALDCAPGRIATSPLIRAQETAEIAARVLEPIHGVERLEHLAPGGDLSELARWLGRQEEDSVMLVGHLPDLAEFGSYLASGDTAVAIALKKAGVLCLSLDKSVKPGHARIDWLIHPEILKALQ